MWLLALTIFLNICLSEKTCQYWTGPKKNWMGMRDASCQTEYIKATDLASCLKACEGKDNCNKLYIYEETSGNYPMTCANIHSCNVADSDILFSDYDDPGTWYACNEPNEQPWEITREPTDASEYAEKSCKEISGLGTTVEDFRRKCRYLQIANRIFPEECDTICEGLEECTHLGATQINLQDPGDIQCFIVACEGELEFVARAESQVVWKECKKGDPVTLEPTVGSPEPTMPVPTKAAVTCDEVNELIASGQCTLPTEAEVTMQPTTAAPTKEMLWQVEGPDRCPLAYKLGIWGHFGKPKDPKKCVKKCKSHPDCVAISYKTENRACTGFSSCPFFESTAAFGGNEGWMNIRVKPEPSTSAFSASFQVEESWTAVRAGERAFACLGLLVVAVLGMKALCSSKSDSIYLQVDNDL